MGELSFIVAGDDAGSAAAALVAALDGGEGITARTEPAPPPAPGDRRSVDPVALATLIVSIPGAALAVWDLMDRIRRKRPRAQAVVETALRLRVERQTEITLLTADRTQHAVADLDADRLLDLVAAIEPATRPPS
jgi:hypothetical protein